MAYGFGGLGSIRAGKLWHGDRSGKLADDILSTHRSREKMK